MTNSTDQERELFEAWYAGHVGVTPERVKSWRQGDSYDEWYTGAVNAWGIWQARAALQPAGLAVPEGLHAIHYRDNWDGQGDTYFILARKGNDGRWIAEETNAELMQYKGDAILHVWPLTKDAAPHPVSGEQAVDQHNAAYWQEQYELLRKDYQRTLDEARVAIPEGFMVLPIKPTPAMKAACRVAGKT